MSTHHKTAQQQVEELQREIRIVLKAMGFAKLADWLIKVIGKG